MKPIVLVADDDPSILEILKLGFRTKGYEVITASDGKSAIQAIEQNRPDLLVLDIEMPHLTGIEVLRHLRKDWPTLPVVIMTAHGTISLAVEAMKEGATEFITKPFEMEQLLLVIQKALEREGLRREVEVLRNEVDSRYETISSVNAEMLRILTTAQKAAQSDATILLLGESGVGKDLLARCIHAWSPRRNKIFTPVNCVALTEELLESELFGHEKGAFTGAHTQKLGKLEVAAGGTVFLDEIGDMKPALQAKLLRFLQNREFDRVGGTRSIKVDVRIVAATNRNLQQAVKDGAFRADLFFRLNVVSLTIPPLRNRQEDIPQLIERSLARLCRDMKRPMSHMSPSAIKKLASYAWPGNVRELENAIERAVVLKTGNLLEPEDFALHSLELQQQESPVNYLPFHDSVEHHKVFIIRDALAKTGGSRAQAAELLGLQPTYLSRLIKQMNIS
ncbi:Sigma-54 dependent transcriptional regulator [Nitrospira defluvii]|jgi:DNA-binding NtrC family response regulator|uniref:DNA-binding transcriptional regulator NtrC n=1 Tax=Nitrospira defluvii TaxID=330214 RepID=D8PET1_9BACT|nr:Sigma-54 dependent transcriptional regulator [Nitrospira defluvii]